MYSVIAEKNIADMKAEAASQAASEEARSMIHLEIILLVCIYVGGVFYELYSFYVCSVIAEKKIADMKAEVASQAAREEARSMIKF